MLQVMINSDPIENTLIHRAPSSFFDIALIFLVRQKSDSQQDGDARTSLPARLQVVIWRNLLVMHSIDKTM